MLQLLHLYNFVLIRSYQGVPFCLLAVPSMPRCHRVPGGCAAGVIEGATAAQSFFFPGLSMLSKQRIGFKGVETADLSLARFLFQVSPHLRHQGSYVTSTHHVSTFGTQGWREKPSGGESAWHVQSRLLPDGWKAMLRWIQRIS